LKTGASGDWTENQQSPTLPFSFFPIYFCRRVIKSGASGDWTKNTQAVVEIRINTCEQKLIKTLRLKGRKVVIVAG
jgi:hypothetical protein